MARRRARTRTVYRKAKSTYRRSRSGFSSVKSILRPVMIGFGGSAIGNIVASRMNVNPIIPSAIAGFIGGGKLGAITAIALPLLAQQGVGLFGGSGKTETPSGTVWS